MVKVRNLTTCKGSFYTLGDETIRLLNLSYQRRTRRPWCECKYRYTIRISISVSKTNLQCIGSTNSVGFPHPPGRIQSGDAEVFWVNDIKQPPSVRKMRHYPLPVILVIEHARQFENIRVLPAMLLDDAIFEGSTSFAETGKSTRRPCHVPSQQTMILLETLSDNGLSFGSPRWSGASVSSAWNMDGKIKFVTGLQIYNWPVCRASTNIAYLKPCQVIQHRLTDWRAGSDEGAFRSFMLC